MSFLKTNFFIWISYQRNNNYFLTWSLNHHFSFRLFFRVISTELRQQAPDIRPWGDSEPSKSRDDARAESRRPPIPVRTSPETQRFDEWERSEMSKNLHFYKRIFRRNLNVKVKMIPGLCSWLLWSRLAWWLLASGRCWRWRGAWWGGGCASRRRSWRRSGPSRSSSCRTGPRLRRD